MRFVATEQPLPVSIHHNQRHFKLSTPRFFSKVFEKKRRMKMLSIKQKQRGGL
jgi:hypothetical protein